MSISEDLSIKLQKLIKKHENIDIKINKIAERENPGQLGLVPGAFMDGY